MDPNGATLPRLAGSEPVHPARRTRRRTVRVALVLAASVVAVVASRSVRRVLVSGGSMAPTLLDGDRLFVVAAPWRLPQVASGDIVAVRDPRDPERLLVKRVATVDRRRGTVEVLGDAAEASTDSRTFGPVPVGAVVGRVAYRYGPTGRSGPLGRPTGYDRD